MALTHNISAEADKESIFVFDITGSHSKQNECGYGDPNLRVSDITNAYLKITPPGGSEITINTYPSFPNEDGIGFEVTAQDLGMSKIVSGVWGIESILEYTTSDGVTEYFAAKCYYLFIDDVKCCILGKYKKVDPLCDPDMYNKASMAVRLLEAAVYASKNGNMARAQKIIDTLINQCNCCL